MQASWLEAWRERCPVLPCFERNTPAVHPRPKSFPARNILAVLALKGPAVIRWNAHDSSFKNYHQELELNLFHRRPARRECDKCESGCKVRTHGPARMCTSNCQVHDLREQSGRHRRPPTSETLSWSPHVTILGHLHVTTVRAGRSNSSR